MPGLLEEKLQSFRATGGKRAALFWLLKKLFGLEVFFFMCGELIEEKLRSGQYRQLAINSVEDLEAADPAIVDRLGHQSGIGVRRLVESGGGIYALLDGGDIVVQENVLWKQRLTVDSPVDLDITLSPGDIFVGYLYTYPAYRNRGVAAALQAWLFDDARRRGFRRAVVHARATNVFSLRLFERRKWRRCGVVLATTGKRLIGIYGTAKHGISIRPGHDR